MGSKLCPKIILEGTRLTLKTEIAFALNEHPRIVGPRKYRYHSPLISAEWCAFTNFPWGRGLINFEPQEQALAMETYRTWLHLFELQRYYSWIVDRFHISTRAYQLQTYGKDYDFRWLEERLHALGFHLVFCTRTPESFAAARAAGGAPAPWPRQPPPPPIAAPSPVSTARRGCRKVSSRPVSPSSASLQAVPAVIITHIGVQPVPAGTWFRLIQKDGEAGILIYGYKVVPA